MIKLTSEHTVPATETTSLAARLMSTETNIATMLGAPKFLHTIKTMHPIDQPEAGMAGRTVVVCDGQLTPLVAPYRITTLSVRASVRRLEQRGDKKAYARAFAGGKSDAQYQQMCADARAAGTDRQEVGRVALIAAFTGTGKDMRCVLGTMDLYATGGRYWERPLASGLCASSACIRVDIDSHLQNIKASPKDPTRKFFAAERFTQWVAEELTAEMRDLLAATVEANSAAINDWMFK